MTMAASCVRVCWDENVSGASLLPHAARRRLVVAGPAVPRTALLLHRTAVGEPVPAAPGYADEHLVADADGASPWPQVADVLLVRGGLRRAAVRREFPGRLVTVYDGPNGEYSVEVAPGWHARLVPLAAGAGTDVWPYGSLVHAWAVAGRSLGALRGAHIVSGPPEARCGVRVSVVERPTAWPVAS
jgi:hypothetical protein